MKNNAKFLNDCFVLFVQKQYA